MGLLDELLASAAASEGRFLLIEGPAGIGKSRLADEVARSARDRGALVVWGRCSEAGGAPAYWPWLETLEQVKSAEPVPPSAGCPAPTAPTFALDEALSRFELSMSDWWTKV